MAYKETDFIPLPSDSEQILASLEAAHDQLHQSRQALAELPVSMFWQEKSGIEYLALGNDNATTKGARPPEIEAGFETFTENKARAKQRSSDADSLIDQRARQYRALRMPAMKDKQGELLRAYDVAGLLRNDLLVVGTNAFAAYETRCRVKFPAGKEPTQDFDLAERRGSLRMQPCP